MWLQDDQGQTSFVLDTLHVKWLCPAVHGLESSETGRISPPHQGSCTVLQEGSSCGISREKDGVRGFSKSILPCELPTLRLEAEADLWECDRFSCNGHGALGMSTKIPLLFRMEWERSLQNQEQLAHLPHLSYPPDYLKTVFNLKILFPEAYKL